MTETLIVVLMVDALVLGAVLVYILRNRKVIQNKLDYDQYTTALNLNKFSEIMNCKLSTAKADEYMLLTFDVDQFSFFSHLYGQESMMKILSHLVNVMNPIVKHYDGIICRISNDNFAIFCKSIPFIVLEQMFRGLPKTPIDEIVGKNLLGKKFLDISAGVYYIEDTKLHHFAIIENADFARISKKKQYGNTLAMFTKQMDQEQRNRISVSNKMQDALATKAFVPYFQPKVDLKTGEVVGAELLVRWHDQSKVIPPGMFIPVMEDNGFILKLDLYMFEEACKCLNMIKSSRVSGIKSISVNLSRASLLYPGLLESLLMIARTYMVHLDMLEIEVTESVFTRNKKVLMEKIHMLKQAGFKIAIDDFGSDYSTLISLYEIEADTVKLDKGFIHTMRTQRGQVLLDSIITTLQKVNFITVSEGIETEEDLQMLVDFECQIGQGYYFQKPVMFEEFIDYCITQNGILSGNGSRRSGRSA